MAPPRTIVVDGHVYELHRYPDGLLVLNGCASLGIPATGLRQLAEALLVEAIEIEGEETATITVHARRRR